MSDHASTLGIGIVGAGFMGHTYARTVAALVPGARVAAVACGSRAPDLAREYEVPCCQDAQALAARSDVDAVCIATPHACHAEHALAAVNAGKHVLIDKPMAASVAECDAILEACRAQGTVCSVTFTQRRRIGFIKTLEVLESGALGRVLETRSYQIVPEGLDTAPAWQRDPANIGTLFGHGVHNFDAVRRLTGREIRAVFAKCRSLAGAPVEATSDVLMTLDDGSVHYLFCSFEVRKPGFPRSEVGVRIACEGGLIDLDPYGETRIAPGGGPWETLAIQPPIDWAGQGYLDPVRLETYAGILRDFTGAVRERRAPEITGWDGRQALAAVMAAYASSREGREVEPA